MGADAAHPAPTGASSYGTPLPADFQDRGGAASAIDWREGDVDDMPYDDGHFDAVVSQFALMLFPSPATALREMKRVLKPGGRLAAAVFGSFEELPAAEAIANAYERHLGKDVGDAVRAPFSLGDPDALHSAFTAAGMSSTAITTDEGTDRFSNPRHMVMADVQGWFPFAGIHLDEPTIEAVVQDAESALAPFRTADGGVEVVWRGRRTRSSSTSGTDRPGDPRPRCASVECSLVTRKHVPRVEPLQRQPPRNRPCERPRRTAPGSSVPGSWV